MTELDRLLRRIRDGETQPALLERARALLRVDERLPPELREIGLEDEDPDIAAGALLGVLGLDEGLFGGLLGEALRAEAGPLDAAVPDPVVPPVEADVPAALPPAGAETSERVTAEMLAAQEAQGLPPVAQAVRAEAGQVELAVDVLRALGVEVIQIGPAVAELAGEVDVAVAVSTRLGALAPPVSQALRHEAGEADVAASVVAPLGDPLWPISQAIRFEAGEIDIAAQVVPETVDVRAAVRAEAGEVDLASAVMGAIGVQEQAPVASAVRAEAGDTVQVWDGIGGAFEPGWLCGLLDHELPTAAHRLAARRIMADPQAGADLAAFADQGRALRTAIRDEAGETPYVWGAVATRIGLQDPEAVPGWDGALVAEAVRAEAGPVRIERGVMERIRRASEATAPMQTPEPANDPRRWQWAGLALAAAVLVGVFVSTLVPFGTLLDGMGSGPTATATAEAPDFASSDEVEVQELSYDEDVEVIMTLPDESGDRPLIIRINEEA